MKKQINNLWRFGAAFVVGISSLLVINVGTAFAVAQNCTWTGASNNNFNTAGNWSNCNSAVPQNGDNLVFDSTSLSSEVTVTNNITNLTINNITFSGSSGLRFTLAGNALTLSGGITNSTSGCPGGGCNLTINNSLTISGAQSVNGGAGGLSLSGALAGSGAITVSAGALVLHGDNSGYSGAITVSSGAILTGDNAHSFGSGAVSVSSGGSLSFVLTADTTVSNDLNLNGTGAFASLGTLSVVKYGGTKLTLSGAVTLNSNITYSGDANTAVTGTLTSNSHTISVLAGESGTITTSSGTTTAPTQTITIDASDISNADVTAGFNQTYIVDGQRGATAVLSGGTLKGIGTVGVLNVLTGGIVAPGHSPGCLATGNLTISGTYQAEIGGTSACTTYDRLSVNGTVNITNGTLAVSLYNSYTPKAGETYTIINNDGSDAVTGTFTGLPEGATFTVSGYVFQITYVGGDGNDVVLTVKSVPATPDTGFGLILNNPLVGVAGSLMMAGGFYILSRKTQELR